MATERDELDAVNSGVGHEALNVIGWRTSCSLAPPPGLLFQLAAEE